jgi:hypothetical protein
MSAGATVRQAISEGTKRSSGAVQSVSTMDVHSYPRYPHCPINGLTPRHSAPRNLPSNPNDPKTTSIMQTSEHSPPTARCQLNILLGSCHSRLPAVAHLNPTPGKQSMTSPRGHPDGRPDSEGRSRSVPAARATARTWIASPAGRLPRICRQIGKWREARSAGGAASYSGACRPNEGGGNDLASTSIAEASAPWSRTQAKAGFDSGATDMETEAPQDAACF